jgi:hypothetical protein
MASPGYRYSYSGTDVKTFVYQPGKVENLQHVESLHTISISVHEAKGQARALGHRGVKGISRGVRTIAGSMIFTVIEDNPLRPFMKATQSESGLGWSVDRRENGTGAGAFDTLDYTNILGGLIHPFNMFGVYASELGSPEVDANGNFAFNFNNLKDNTIGTQLGRAKVKGASWMLEGVEFVDEGIVSSINDIVTEVTVSFIACNYRPFSLTDLNPGINFIQDLPSRDLQEEAKRRLWVDNFNPQGQLDIYGTQTATGENSNPVRTTLLEQAAYEGKI